MRYWFLVALAVMAALLSSASAQAQFTGTYGYYGRAGPPNYGPGFRPQLSPYLNIIRGRNFGVDYYLGTRQEFLRRENTINFRSDIADLRAREAAPGVLVIGPPTPIESGTTVSFGNTRGYFSTPNFVQQPITQPGGAAQQAAAFAGSRSAGR
jgi:hypothetical protein